jgi:hypothetical protein
MIDKGKESVPSLHTTHFFYAQKEGHENDHFHFIHACKTDRLTLQNSIGFLLFLFSHHKQITKSPSSSRLCSRAHQPSQSQPAGPIAAVHQSSAAAQPTVPHVTDIWTPRLSCPHMSPSPTTTRVVYAAHPHEAARPPFVYERAPLRRIPPHHTKTRSQLVA